MHRVEEKLATFHLPKNCMVATRLELAFDAKFMSSFKNVQKVKENASNLSRTYIFFICNFESLS